MTLESPSNYNMVIYSQRGYGERKEQEVWYLLTDLCDANEVVNLYKRRWVIEAMFKDYKTGGYRRGKNEGRTTRKNANSNSNSLHNSCGKRGENQRKSS